MNMFEIHADSSDQENDEFLMDTEDFHHFMLPVEWMMHQEPMEPASEQADEFRSDNQVNIFLEIEISCKKISN